jgi:hypothetical protein
MDTIEAMIFSLKRTEKQCILMCVFQKKKKKNQERKTLAWRGTAEK